MSASNSYLSDPHYGYDVVVSTTQESINSVMKMFLSKLPEPLTRICFKYQDKHNPIVPIDYEELKKKANGTDPFKNPPDASPDDPGLHNLLNAKFVGGFRAQVGLPPGYSPIDTPDLVVLGAESSQVTFKLLCSQFQIVQLTPPSSYDLDVGWLNVSQQPGKAWIMESQVKLRHFVISDPRKDPNLPPDVRKTLDNLGGGYIQRQAITF